MAVLGSHAQKTTSALRGFLVQKVVSIKFSAACGGRKSNSLYINLHCWPKKKMAEYFWTPSMGGGFPNPGGVQKIAPPRGPPWASYLHTLRRRRRRKKQKQNRTWKTKNV